MRWIVRGLGAVAVLLLLGVGALFLLPAERIAQAVADRVSQQTGRTVTVAGDVRPQLWPQLGVVAQEISIANPDWAGPDPMLRAEEITLRLSWNGLFSGDYHVETASIRGAELVLMRREDGALSWDIGTGSPPTEAEAENDTAQASTFRIDQAEIVETAIRYLDAETGEAWDVRDLNARIETTDPSVLGTLALSASVNGTPLDLTGTLTDATELLALRNLSLVAELAWPGGTLAWDGRVSATPSALGAITLEATDLGPLVGLAGVEMPDLPQGFGRDRLVVQGNLTLADEGSLHLREGQVELDQTALNVAFDLLPGEERPLLRGTITGGAIALPGLLESGGAGGASAAPATGASGGWPRDTIDVSGLFAADAEMTVVAESLDLGAVTLSQIDLRATLDRGRLALDIAQIGTYGGQLAGQFVVNGRGGLSVGGDLILTNVDLQPLMRDMAGFDRLQGTGSASLEFLGVGRSMQAIMDSLEGDGDLSLGAGAILGLDLAGMIRNFDLSHQGEGMRTVYDSMSANFQIQDGVVLNEDLRLDAPWGEVQGAGEVDLGAMSVAYQVTPGVLRDETGEAGLRVPILIEGPWSAPRFRPDLEALAEIELSEQAARLEEEARARLAEEQDRLEELARTRANEALGLEIEAGDSPDAIQEQLEQGAVSGLQRLIFGGGGEAADPEGGGN